VSEHLRVSLSRSSFLFAGMTNGNDSNNNETLDDPYPRDRK
jgi:hypothetical protein